MDGLDAIATRSGAATCQFASRFALPWETLATFLGRQHCVALGHQVPLFVQLASPYFVALGRCLLPQARSTM